MGDKRGRQDTHDTGSATSRPRDDLRTATKREKPHDLRAEGRDKEDEPQQPQTEETDKGDH